MIDIGEGDRTRGRKRGRRRQCGRMTKEAVVEGLKEERSLSREKR